MKLYAHRGWAIGQDENSLKVFERAAGSHHLDGVEFDIRRDRDGRLAVIHDPIKPTDQPPLLDEVLDILAPTDLGLFAEIKEAEIASDVIATFTDRGLADRTVVFGFPKSAAGLPWQERRAIRLGLIAHLPWQADALAGQFRPDILMAGWDKRSWTRRAFKIWWSLRSFRKLGAKHDAQIVGGIVQRHQDHRWLKAKGFDIATVDLDSAAGERLVDGTDLASLG